MNEEGGDYAGGTSVEQQEESHEESLEESKDEEGGGSDYGEDDEEEVEAIEHELADGTIVLLDEADGTIYDFHTFEALGKLNKEANTLIADDEEADAGQDAVNHTLADGTIVLLYEADGTVYDPDTFESLGKLDKVTNAIVAVGEETRKAEEAVEHTLADGTVVFLDEADGTVYDPDTFEALGKLDKETNELMAVDEDDEEGEYGAWEGEVEDWDYDEDEDDGDEFVVLEEVFFSFFSKLCFSINSWNSPIR
jgi:hypothetical protein